MTPERRTTLYLTMANLCTAAIVLHIAARAFDWPDFVKGLPIGMLLIGLAMLLRRKLRDEYIESLWNAGTSLAFAALVFGFVFAPFLEGLFDGFQGVPRSFDAPISLAPAFAILAFFIGFHWKRWSAR